MTGPLKDPRSVLSDDHKILRELILKVQQDGGVTLGFKNSQSARAARRKMYYLAETLVLEDRQSFNAVVLRIVGRTLKIEPRLSLQTIVQESENATSSNSEPLPGSN